MLYASLKKIAIAVGAMVLIVAAGAMAKTVADKARDLNEKVGILELQLAALGRDVQKLTGRSFEYALSIQELQNRKEAREKSQDELLTGSVSRVAPSVVSIVV